MSELSVSELSVSELPVSELRVNASGKDIRRPAIGIVARIADKLIIDRYPRRSGQRVAVISFHNSFHAGMRQLPVADQDAGPAGVEIGLVNAGDAIDDAADPDGVVGPAPLLAVDRYAAGECPVDVGEISGLDGTVRPAAASKDAERLGDLLLQIDAYAGARVVLGAHQPGVGRHAGGLRKRDGVGE